MRNLLRAGYDTDLVDGTDLRAQPSVHTKNLSIDDGSEDQEVKDVAAGLPHGGVAVLLLAFFVEAIHLGDLPRLVVSADKDNAVRISGRP
jgi:hypothetical protein